MMKIVNKIIQMQQVAERHRREGKIIGFVPTMGYLHQGHVSLINEIRSRCDVLVVSIFVNPTQFGPGEDLKSYPRDFARDKKICAAEKVDILFFPNGEQMYPSPYHTRINIGYLVDVMCGISRPGHFEGVATVVAKLFHIVKPHIAIFGEKDYQQALIIRQMVKDLNFEVQIITAPIIREADGLAMSSRNKYLTSEERKNATRLYQSLKLAQQRVQEGTRNSSSIKSDMEQLLHQIPGAKIDYISIADPQTLISLDVVDGNVLIALAVFIGKTRLIDNMIIQG